MKKIYSLAILLLAFNSYAQIKNNGKPTDNGINSSTAFIDASSSVEWNKSTNIGKGLVFPRTDLTQLKSLAAPVNGLPASFPTRLDGMIVYNTASGTSGIGKTAVTPGFYYYKNDSKKLDGGTWVRIGTAGNNDTPFNIGKWHYVLDFAANNSRFNGSQATNGLKIKTNIPFESGKYMPLIKIQGYAFKEGAPLDINLVFYIYNGRFINYSATSSGGVAPKLKLANEDGKVVIFLDLKGEKSYYTRFNVQAFENFASVDSDFKGWSVVDEAITGSSMVDVEYRTSTPYFYTQNGTLTENRTVNLDNKNLAFTGGQVGINTKEPKATLDIQANPNKTTVNDGILIPRVGTAKRNSYTEPENGLMVYNTDLNCYETNVGTPQEPEWQCLATAQKVQAIGIEPVGFIGNYRYGTNNNPSEKKVLFKVTNNTNSTISGIDLSYVHVDGRTQYVERGQNSNVSIPGNSSKVLEYGISGGNWSEESVFTLTYDQYSSASITLIVDKENVLTNPDRQGTGDGGTATIGEMKKEIFLVKDNSASTPINKTLTISARKPLKVKIPFTNGTGNYLGYTSPAVEIQDVNGKTREIQLSYVEGNLDIGKGFIDATIESRDGKDLTLPQTKLGKSLTIAKIPVRLNNKDKGTFDLVAFGGIPDKRFGDGSGHDFVYTTVTSPTGKVWLNNNLGAEYARIQSPVFNPQQQAQSLGDVNAYGSRFQYHRYSDGHELTHIIGGQYQTNKNTIQVLSENFRPNNTKVIINPESNIFPQEDRKYNWVEIDYLSNHQTEWKNLWEGVDGANNPCPEGFRIPTIAEAQNEMNYLKQKSDIGAFNSVLKFTHQFWLSQSNRLFDANPSNAYISSNGDQYVNNVRCIKN